MPPDPITPQSAASDSFWLTPQGKMVRVDATQAPTLARTPGFQPAPAEMVHRYFLDQEYGGDGQALAAGAEGFGRAATLGLSTPIEKALGVSNEGIASRELLHPLAGNIGYGLGILAPLVGAPEAVAGKAAAEGAVDATAQAAGLGLREMAAPTWIARAGNIVAKNVEDRGLTKLVSGTAQLATESGLYGVGDVIHEASLGDPDLNGEGLLINGGKHVLESAALGGALGVTGGLLGAATGLLRPKIAPWLRGMEEEVYTHKLGVTNVEQRALVREMADKGLTGPFVSVQETNARSTAMLRDVGQRMEALTADASAAAAGKPSVLGDGTKLLKDLRELADEMGDSRLKKAPAQKMRDYANDLEEQWKGRFEELRQRARFEGVKDAETEPFRNKLSPTDVWKLREDLDELLRGPKGNLDVEGTWYRKGLNDFRWKVADELTATIDRAGLPSKEWKALNRDYHVASEAQDLSKTMMDREVKNSMFSLTEKGAAIGGLLHGTATGALGSTAYVLAHKYGGDLTALAARSLTGGLAPAAEAVATAESQGALRTVMSNTERILKRIGDTAKGLMESKLTPHLVAPAASETLDRIDHVRRLSSDAGQLQQWAGSHTNDLAAHAPNTALSAQAAMARAVTYLAQTAPAGRPATGLDKGTPPTKADLAAWNQRFETVKDPLEVISKGVLSKETLDTLKVVYPRVYSEVRSQLLEQITTNPNVSYQRGLQISQLLGVPLYGSQQPQAAMTNISTSPSQPLPPMMPPPKLTSRNSGNSSRMGVPLTALGSLYKLQ